MRELKIDSKKVELKLTRFIRNQTKTAGFKRVVVGLSGRKSTLELGLSGKNERSGII